MDADGGPDDMEDDGQDSETDQNVKNFDLERLDFDDEKGYNAAE
jgi:hypothetical protein